MVEASKVKMFLYVSPYTILRTFLTDNKENPEKNRIRVLNDDGQWHKISVASMIRRIKRERCWGFCVEDQIHIWFQQDVSMEELIYLLGHERGHMFPPTKRDPTMEEEKADTFADTALFAYTMAKRLKRAGNRTQKKGKTK